MTDRETLCSGISRIGWGYVVLHFNFSIGSVNLLPSFAAYLLFRSGLKKLRSVHRDLRLLEPVAAGLAGFYLLDWILILLGSSMERLVPIAGTVAGVMSLYFHFQLLTDLAELADAYQPEGSTTAGSLRRLRSVQTLLLTALSLPMRQIGLRDTWIAYGMIFLAVVGIGVVILIIAHLHTLKTDLQEAEA